MTGKIGMILLAVCVVTLLFSGCTSRQSKKPDTVSANEAEKLVTAWAKEHNWNNQLRLKEVTTEEVLERLQVRVFQTESMDGAYLVKDRKVYPIDVGFGGPGLAELRVCDIDNDSQDDLVYVYGCGSGIHRSEVEAYRFNRQEPTKIPSAFAVMNAGVSLKKKGEHKIDLFTTDNKVRIGELVLAKSKEREFLDIKPDASLPEKWKKNIWKHDASAK